MQYDGLAALYRGYYEGEIEGGEIERELWLQPGIWSRWWQWVTLAVQLVAVGLGGVALLGTLRGRTRSGRLIWKYTVVMLGLMVASELFMEIMARIDG